MLDFGLAKLAPEAKRVAEGVGASALPTAGTAEELLTSPGVAMGTVAYMSPEQARGEELDTRTDLFSFGAALYEMATGRQPFSGTTSALIFDAILHGAPTSPVRLNPELPAELERIITKALEKDREVRYQHASDVRADLKRLKRDTESGRSAASVATGAVHEPLVQRRRAVTKNLVWAFAVLAFLVAVGGAVWFRLAQHKTEAPLPPPKMFPLTSSLGLEWDPAFSPDGKQLAFAWDGGKGGDFSIYLKLIGAGAPLRLTATHGSDRAPAWSPDGRYIAFLRRSAGVTSIFVIPALGGPERKLGDSAGSWLGGAPGGHGWWSPKLSWSPDGKFLAIVDKSSARDTASSCSRQRRLKSRE